MRSSEPSLLIADDTRSQKIELVNDHYSGNTHDVIAGIGLVNMLGHGLDSEAV